MKRFVVIVSVLFLSVFPFSESKAQIPIIEVIKAGIKKVIRALDLQVQRLQNKTIWLQNAQKAIENEMSRLKLTEISDWANKQKALYSNYFDELWKVKKIISTYKSVKEIIDKQVMMVKEYSRAFDLAKKDKNFTADELQYMQKVYTGMLGESIKNIEQIELVINAFATQMTDAKRLEIIHAADDNMDQNLSDLRQFNQQNIIISLQRAKEKNDIDIVKKLYGIE